MEKEIKFSFLRLFNSIKGIHKPEKEFDIKWLENSAKEEVQQKFKNFYDWAFANGIEFPKLQYPVMFGSGNSQYFQLFILNLLSACYQGFKSQNYILQISKIENIYPGMMATEDIGPNEIMLKVPAKLLLSTKACFRGDINQIFLENPELFGKHVSDGEDNVLNAFILYELGKGEKSFWKPMFDVWPRDTDILFNWEEEDLDWLQDPTLKQDAQIAYQQLITFWRRMFDILILYPQYFPNEDMISFDKYKWVYMLTTNRCFGSNWPGVCSMIPFAEFINHENVDIQYDYVDQQLNSITGRREERKKEEKEQRIMQALKKKLFMEDLREDLQKMDQELRELQAKQAKLREEGKDIDSSELLVMQEAFERDARRKEQEFQLRVQMGDNITKSSSDNESEDSSDDESNIKRDQSDIKPSLDNDNYDYSSGIDSDNDADLLLEQEQLNAIKFRQQQKEKEKVELIAKGELPSEKSCKTPVLTNEEVFNIWDKTVSQVPDDFNFIIRTYNDGFPKGSQVFLCYGRMSNREMLKRYGFCLTYNKYNYIFIKLRLEQQDPDFIYRKYVLRKFFSIEPETDKMDISSRHFRIYFQKLNTKVLKFIKILYFNVQEDDISCIVETRSLSLEYLAFQRLRDVYETFLKSFPTTIGEDKKILSEQRDKLNGNKFFALTYRMEFKRILINQITLVKLVIHILERLMKGMTLEFAVTRVFEFESKKEMVVNRIMIDNYLTSLNLQQVED